MKRRLLLILAAVQRAGDAHFRLIKYSEFPPLSLMTIAGLTPDGWDIVLRDEHVESSEIDGDVDLVGIQTYISSAGRAYELADRWRRRGAKVVLGGLHPTSLPYEAAEHADAVCIGPAETVWGQILDDYEHGRLQKFYRGRCEGSAALVPIPRRDLMNQRAYLVRHTMVTSRGCPHACDFCYKSSFWGPTYYEPRPIAAVERELSGDRRPPGVLPRRQSLGQSASCPRAVRRAPRFGHRLAGGRFARCGPRSALSRRGLRGRAAAAFSWASSRSRRRTCAATTSR